jgi:hypothetical protein
MSQCSADSSKWLVSLASLLMVMTITAGCGRSPASVTGSVTIDGTPVTSGRVVFHKDGQAPAIANIKEDGTFELAIANSKGIQPGHYRVTVASYEIGTPARPGDPPPAKLTTPRLYMDVGTTPLASDIGTGRNEIALKLVTK